MLCYDVYSPTAQDVQVCVSFTNPATADPFINVNWTVSCTDVLNIHC